MLFLKTYLANITTLLGFYAIVDSIFYHLILLYIGQGHLKEAQYYYNLSLSSSPLSSRSIRTANCLSNLGLLYKDLGEMDKAEEYLEKAVNMNVEVGGRESGGTAIAINNLAGFFKEIGKYGKVKKIN